MFTAHTQATAPETSKQVLGAVEKKMGFVPNLFGALAESPAAIQAYVQLDQLLNQTDLAGQDLQLVLLATSVTNQCEFCVAAHTAGATKANVDADTLDAVRRGNNPGNDKQAALVEFVRTLVNERGWAPKASVQAFLDAGYTKENVFDVITAVGLKTLSNYSNHLAQPELNPELEQFRWDHNQVA